MLATMFEDGPRISGSSKADSFVFSRNTSTSSGTAVDEAEEKVYVSVKKEYKQGKSTLAWALKNNPSAKKFILVHVHQPDLTIPMMGGLFHVSQLKPEQVKSYRLLEIAKIKLTLDEYLPICKDAKVQVEKLVIEMDDVAKGLIELISQHHITRLVMGAAADKHYSRKMEAPKSKTACTIQKEAPLFCNIWFVCKGYLICIREAIQEHLLPDPMPDLHRRENASSLSELDTGAAESLVNMDISSSQLQQLNTTESEFGFGFDNFITDNLENPVNVNFSSPQIHQDNTVIDYLCGQLEQAHLEAAKLKDDAHEELRKRRKAEMELLRANLRANASEMKYAEDMKLRKDIEEKLAREKLDFEKFKNQHDEVFRKLQNANGRISEYDHVIKDFEERLTTAHHLQNSLQRERDEMMKHQDEVQRERNEFRRERDELRRELDELQKEQDKLQKEQDKLQKEQDDVFQVEELPGMGEESSSSSIYRSHKFTEFSYTELEQATHNFESSSKMGDCGYGNVYKGLLCHTMVAITVLQSHSSLSQSEFYREVEVLSRLRHPNLVTLIGTCSEARAVIHEFLPNGSLEDRLACKDSTAPLSWQVRIRISAEICSALIFLHSQKPQSLVHGDLRPANILLNVNFVSKVAGFGISRLIQSKTTTLYHWSDPKETFGYMDPDLFSSGELTTCSDIYSYGIILLRLLTGMPALGIVKEVHQLLKTGKLQSILDSAAGDWPYVQAQQLVHLGLRCCGMNRSSRPDLQRDVWSMLKMTMGVSSPRRSSSSRSSEEESSPVLSIRGDGCKVVARKKHGIDKR